MVMSNEVPDHVEDQDEMDISGPHLSEYVLSPAELILYKVNLRFNWHKLIQCQ